MPVEGRYCLHLRFLGLKNVIFSHISQIIPVEPGKVYRLSFSRKSQALTTDQGVFLEVGGYQCDGLKVRSIPVRGTTPWTQGGSAGVRSRWVRSRSVERAAKRKPHV